MTLQEAISFIRPAITPARGTWADIGAGTGLFSEALMQILEEGKIIAVDKSPHVLFNLEQANHIDFEIKSCDFHHPMDLPLMDGIVMVNALHYGQDHVAVLQNVLESLKPGGRFVLIEYDTDIPNDPWVPNPVSLKRFKQLSETVGLRNLNLIATRPSLYSDNHMYVIEAVSES